MSDIKS